MPGRRASRAAHCQPGKRSQIATKPRAPEAREPSGRRTWKRRAFFLEAVFLGIMLFGFNRVQAWAHIGATALVAFGTTMSAFWILVLNSWMHTPAGFEMIDCVVHATDWWAIVFNPSMPYRLAHMLLASGLTVAFLIAGLSALRWLLGDRSAEVRKTLKVGVVTAAMLIPVQILAGDMHGLNTLEHQPAKVAAMEGNWSDTDGNTSLILFGLPDSETRENRFEVAIPSMASIILTHKPEGVIPALDDFVAEDGKVLHPPMDKVFWSFRVMVGTGMAMLALSWAAAFVMWRRRGTDAGLPKPFLWALSGMTFSGWIATLTGWYTTEIGRQPWLVNGVVTTADAVADVPAPMVLSTLLVYLAIYFGLTFAYIGVLTYLSRRAANGAPERATPPRSGAAEAEVIAEQAAKTGQRANGGGRGMMYLFGDPTVWLPAAFAILLGVSVLAYVILDGFDLGVGILSPLETGDRTALSEGFMLGLYIMGLQWTTASVAFAILTAFGVAVSYAFIGALWLVAKCENGLQERARVWALSTLSFVAVGLAGVSIATPLVSARVAERWFSFPEMVLLAPLPLMAAGLLAAVWGGLRYLPLQNARLAWLPFIAGSVLFCVSFAGLAYSFYPYVVPDALTIYEAASAPEALIIIFIGACIVMPVIIGYTILAYVIFWGKARDLRYY